MTAPAVAHGPDVERSLQSGRCQVAARRQRGASLHLKRALDLFGALAALIVLSPLLMVTALAIYLESRGPILYRGERVGHEGTPFLIYKFRSMVVDASPALHERQLQAAMRVTDGPCPDTYKIVNDPRVTRVGQFIRRFSIDELPQLFNVLKGEMSLVGPRPEVPYALPLYEPWHHRRFDVLPGMTGLWQVSGRACLSQLEMLRLDVEYADSWTLRADVRILIKTVRPLIGRIGAG